MLCFQLALRTADRAKPTELENATLDNATPVITSTLERPQPACVCYRLKPLFRSFRPAYLRLTNRQERIK